MNVLENQLYKLIVDITNMARNQDRTLTSSYRAYDVQQAQILEAVY